MSLSRSSISTAVNCKYRLMLLCLRVLTDGHSVFRADMSDADAMMAALDRIPADEVRKQDVTEDQAFDLVVAFFDGDHSFLPRRFGQHLAGVTLERSGKQKGFEY
jgi:hypothetical protein